MAAKKQTGKGWHPEPERKFLVLSHPPETAYAEAYHNPHDVIQQVYLRTKFPIVRVRRITSFGVIGLPTERKIFLGIKKRKNSNDWRGQEELQEGLSAQAWDVLGVMPGPPYMIIKVRQKIGRFDFDIFSEGALAGLKLLEIELSDPDEEFAIPEGFEVIEVTEDPRFRGENLAQIKTNKKLQALIASVIGEHRNATT